MNINNLNECALNGIKSHYIYKNVDFLVDLQNKANKLVVLFHGGRCEAKLPIFRGYNYSHNDFIFLSISDPLLVKYEKTNITWYSDSKKYKFSDTIEEIINYCQNVSSCNDLLLVGQCSGAYAALKYSVKFNSELLITNPQLCINTKIKCVQSQCIENALAKLIYDLKINDDEINLDLLDINNIITHKFVKKIMCFVHIDDYTFDSFAYLKYLVENNILKTNNSKFICQTYKTDDPHAGFFPNNIKLNEHESMLYHIIVNYNEYIK
jgi:hypothetical protein